MSSLGVRLLLEETDMLIEAIRIKESMNQRSLQHRALPRWQRRAIIARAGDDQGLQQIGQLR